MARVTVEDCVEEIPNRFELVILAAQRSRNIASGAPITINRDNDKNPVIALREIAMSNIDIDNLRSSQIASLQKNNKVDQAQEENLHAEKQDSVDRDDEFAYSSKVENDSFSDDISIEPGLEIDFSDNIDE